MAVNMFQDASNVVISGGIFEAHAYTTHQSSWQKGMEILRHNIAPTAFHNSDTNCDPPKCHPHTRQSIISSITKWVKTTDSERKAFFLWLYGPAGSGKTAIAHTIAEICDAEGILAASFFFSRNSTGRDDRTRLVATIAYQLTISIPEMREGICLALENDPMMFSRSLDAQYSALVVLPFRNAMSNGTHNSRTRPFLIILDGLDECHDAQSQSNILTLFATNLQRHPLPFCFLVASRPEFTIRRTFDDDTLLNITTRLVLDNNYRPNEDIRLFFNDKFTELKRHHPAGSTIPDHWPHDNDIECLVRKSSGQFIYAATVIKYVCSYRDWPPERLDHVFGVSCGGDVSPFAELDAFYHHILTAASVSEKTMDIIKILVLRPLGRLTRTKKKIELFMGYRHGELDILLSDLHSIIYVPPHDGYYEELRILHPSLYDFLLDRERSGRFFIDRGDAYAKFTLQFLHHMQPPALWLQTLSNLAPEPAVLQSCHESCLQANATPELLQALYQMDISSVLFYNYGNYGTLSCGDDPTILLQLVCWLTKHQLPRYEVNIMQYHSASFHDWIRGCLQKMPNGDLTTYFILSVLSDPPIMSPIINELAGIYKWNISAQFNALIGIDYLDTGLHSQALTNIRFGWLLKYAEYWSLVSEFLKDQTRVGTLFVGGETYARLALTCWKSICRRNYLEQGEPNPYMSPCHRVTCGIYITSELAEIKNYAAVASNRLGKLVLRVFTILLGKSSRDPVLVSQFLEARVHERQYPETDPLYTERLEVIEAMAQYLRLP